jgi:hypothetical protein
VERLREGSSSRRFVPPYFTGIGVTRSTGTAATRFCGEHSISRSA